MNTRLTEEKITTTVAKIVSDIESLNKEHRITQKYAMSGEQSYAWTCLLYHMGEDENGSITVPLSDIWREEIPGTEEMTVTLEGDGDSGYYMVLNDGGDVYDAEVEDVSFRLPASGFSYTMIDGLPAECTMQNILLHSALASLLTEAGIFEDETKYNEYK